MGIASIQMGPWFNAPVPPLAPPDPDTLAVTINDVNWLPPLPGLFSLIVPQSISGGGETLLHKSIMHLQNTAGDPVFLGRSGKMIGLFTLLPEVFLRLQQLYLQFDRLRAGDSLKRAGPRQFAVLFDAPADIGALNVLIDPDIDATEDGVKIPGLQGVGPFENGPAPMARLETIHH